MCFLSILEERALIGYVIAAYKRVFNKSKPIWIEINIRLQNIS